MAEEESAGTAEGIQLRREREAEQWRQAQLKSADAAEANANFQVRAGLVLPAPQGRMAAAARATHIPTCPETVHQPQHQYQHHLQQPQQQQPHPHPQLCPEDMCINTTAPNFTVCIPFTSTRTTQHHWQHSNHLHHHHCPRTP